MQSAKRPRLRRARTRNGNVPGWYMPSSKETFGYLPDGIFTPTEGPHAGRASSYYESELIFDDQEGAA